jgi:hypothetical protein
LALTNQNHCHMSRLPLKTTTVKKLFALSGNFCSFPDCAEHMVDHDGNVLGEICHIEAAEQNGERYNSTSDDEYRRSFENLILMCGKHHKVTNDVEKYDTQTLKKYKAMHEKKHVQQPYQPSDKTVEEAISKEIAQVLNNTGPGTQINNTANSQHIGNQIGTQHIHHYDKNEKNKLNIDGARKVNAELKKLLDSSKKIASPPDSTVIDYLNELQDKTPRSVELIPTRFLKFRKDNGRIKAEVESYEKSNQVILDEESDEGQRLLKDFLIKNDKESNEELKKLLIHKGQREPAIITCDGFLINGNRRKMALEELYLEKDQDPNFEMMRVVILPEGALELDILKIENRYQLQGEGKSDYQGLNRALTIKRNMEKGFTLRAQLKDDPQYHDLPAKELAKKEEEYKKKFLMPLECVDRYLNLFDNDGLYNLISENVNDKDGRWQSFLDYSNFYNSTLNNPAKRVEYKIKDNEVRKIENAIFKIIRKRSLNSKELEAAIGKLHDFVRKAPKYLKNADAKKFILKIADDVPEDVPDNLKSNKDGEKYDERTIDEKWGTHFKNEILGNLMQAHKIVANQSDRDKPLELLEDALKKLNHENLIIGNMDIKDYDKAMELTQKIEAKAEDIYGAIDKARYQLKKLKK